MQGKCNPHLELRRRMKLKRELWRETKRGRNLCDEGSLIVQSTAFDD